MPRTSAYDADANPNRAGQPNAGWDSILVVDTKTDESWGWNGAYGEADAPVPPSLAARRYRALGEPAAGENQQPMKPGQEDF